GLKNGKFLEIGEIAVNYYKEAHHNDKECPVEDENLDLQELAKTMFAIVPSQANCERSFSILKWFTEGRRTQLQVPQLESMAQLHSFYISNVEKELKLHDFVEIELRNSALNETIFAEIDCLDLNNCEEEDEINTVDFITNDITAALQDLVDLSNPIFGADKIK
ncbi:19292_t:CDS:2, partial [Gigaspora rosea]